MIKKAILDLLSTLYDDYEFKQMSLPRVGLAVGILMVMISGIAQQFFGYKFEYFPDLVKLVIALAATYGIKKYVEKEVK